MPVNVNRMPERARAAKPNAAVVGGALKASGLLPRSLPTMARSVAAKPEGAKRLGEAVPVPAAAAKPAQVKTINPSFARMAACMRFRGYIAS